MNLNREECLFQMALEKPAEKRAAFLDVMSEGDSVLRARLEALLAAHEQTEGALTDTRPAQVATMKLEFADAPDETIGQTLGRYKLLERVGEGGCGVVYVAEQTEPVRRRVALKVIKLGMDTKQVVARFEAERQALAMMDHPNIAKVLDAGATESGRPYFIMELVRGIRITDYCDQNNLSTKERLDLFIKVCQAIQHAHQKGIIHRDIKPSNILVTLHDGVPVPKVIDFGIAKATEGRLTDNTVYTQLHQFIGTPAYMSPEQAEMSGLDIDTRSDIYSLGVLLYELLTGKTPFDAQELMSQGIDAMRKTIREKEPVRPSTKLSQTIGAANVSSLKASTSGKPTTEEEVRADSRRLLRLKETIHQLKGDLDWIVMKCLEKDRQRRYESANGLAADLKRHLNNEPVVARPPSTAYRFQKAVRRNKLAFAAVGAVVAALVIGLVVSTWLFARETQAHNRALAAERRQTELRQQAEQARGEAQDARVSAEENARKLEENLYFNRVALAHRELTAEPPNIHDAEQLLDACPTPLRDWEWCCLKRLRFAEPTRLGDGRSSEVFGLGFSPDGQHLAAARGDGTVQIWSPATRQLAKTLPGHTNFAFCVAFHPRDSTRLVSAGGDRRVRLWDWKSGVELHSWPGNAVYEYGTAYSLAFSPDGGRLAALGEGGLVNIWDTESYARVHALPGHEQGAMGVAFSPDGTRLATSSHGGIVRLWDAATGQLQGEFGELGPPVSCVAFSPDGRELAATSFDAVVRVWDLTEGSREPRSRFRGLGFPALGAAYSANGRRLAVTGMDRIVTLWDPASGRPVLALRDLAGEGQCVRFSPDGNRLAAACEDGMVRIWDATNLGKEDDPSLLTLRYQSDIWALALAPRTNWIALGGDRYGDPKLKSSPVLIYETGTDRLVHRLPGLSGVVMSLAFDPTGKFLAACGDGPQRPDNSTPVVWDLATGAEPFQVEPFEGNGIVMAVAYSPDGKRLVGGGPDGKLKVWDARTGRKIGVAGEDKRQIQMLAFSPDGRFLASSGSEYVVKLWDATRLDEWQESLRDFPSVRKDISTCLAFSPDSARIVVAKDDDSARVFDVTTGQSRAELRSPGHRFLALAYSPDERWIASGGSDCTVKLWDAETGRNCHIFRGHTSAITRLAYVQRPEGLHLISTGRDGTLRYWDVNKALMPKDVSIPETQVR